MPYIPSSRGHDAKNVHNNSPPPSPVPKTKKEKKADAKAEKRNMKSKPMPTAVPLDAKHPEVKTGQRGYKAATAVPKKTVQTGENGVKTTVNTGKNGVKSVTERKVLVGFPYGRTPVGQTKWFGLGTRGVGTAVA